MWQRMTLPLEVTVMYEEHFGLHSRPFSKTPDPRFLYEGKQHSEALARMLYAVEEREIAVLTGEIGAGKTLLSRALLDRLEENHRCMLLINPRLSAAQLLSFVAERLEIKDRGRTKTEILDAITGRLYELNEEGTPVLLIIDEAQLLPSKDVVEELRLLTNIQLDDTPLLALLLIGQPELRDKLGKKTFRSFAQRIGMAFHLEPFDEGETANYIAHRLEVAGATREIFTSDAIASVYEATFGVPRRINTICQAGLLSAFGEDLRQVESAVVEDVVADLSRHLGPMFEAPRQPAGLRQRKAS